MAPPSVPSASAAMLIGSVMHSRQVPARNGFRYPLRQLLVRLSPEGWPSGTGVAFERPGLLSVYSRDHGARDGSPLLPWIRARLARFGLTARCDGDVWLQTMPRMFGFVFNPVSFWYCHDREGALQAVLAEVNNTFGESHDYLLFHDAPRAITGDDELVARKCFHVSPFLGTEGEYRFRFALEASRREVCIDYWRDGRRVLVTTVSGELAALDAPACRRWVWHQPLMTVGVVTRIHWQAVRLWWKRVPFHRKPIPPIEDISR